MTEKSFRGTIIDACDTALMANVRDGGNRGPHQLITILLDEVSAKEFHSIALSKKIQINLEQK